jgi:hypothetical protein
MQKSKSKKYLNWLYVLHYYYFAYFLHILLLAFIYYVILHIIKIARNILEYIIIAKIETVLENLCLYSCL